MASRILQDGTTTTISLEKAMLEKIQEQCTGREAVSQWLRDAAEQKFKRQQRKLARQQSHAGLAKH